MNPAFDPDSTPSAKALRLFALLLFNRRAYSLTELATILNVSKPAASRLVRNLENAGIGQISREKQARETWFKLERVSQAGKISLNADGLEQLFFCNALLANLLPENMRDRIGSTLSQAVSFLPSPATSLNPVPALTLSRGRIDYSPFQEILTRLIDAIKGGLVCEIAYLAREGKEPKKYFFAPKRIISYNECLYADGWKVTDGEPPERVYDDPLRLALQRFKDCALTGISSAHLPDTPTRNEAFGLMQWDEFAIRAQFWGAAATYVRERQWSAGQTIEEQPDDSIILTATMNNEQEALSWLLGFGPNARLLEPDWLVRQLRGAIRKVGALYKKDFEPSSKP